MIDNKVNDKALLYLSFSPLLMLVFGFWQLGNRQMFFDIVMPIECASDVINPNHYIDGVQFNHTHLFLVFIVIFVFQYPYRKCLQRFFVKLGLFQDMSDKKINGDFELSNSHDEKIGSYFECINGLHQKRWLAQELFNQKVLRRRTLDDENLEKLRVSKR